MGNSEVGHLTIGSGRILYQDLVRVSRAVEDGLVLREPGARRRVPARARARGRRPPARARLDRRRPLAHRPPARAARARPARRAWRTRTWIHAFTDGRDVSPDGGRHRPRDAAGRSHRDGRRPLLRDGPRQALGADGQRRSPRSVDGVGEHADDPVAAVRASYARGMTDEFVEPVVLDGRPRLDPAARRGDRLQLPSRPRAPAHRAAARARASTS